MKGVHGWREGKRGKDRSTMIEKKKKEEEYKKDNTGRRNVNFAMDGVREEGRQKNN